MNLKTRQFSAIAVRLTGAALLLAATFGFSCDNNSQNQSDLGVTLAVDPLPVTKGHLASASRI